MFYPSNSEVKTLPLSEERVKHSSEGCFSGSPKIFQVIGYFFSVRSLTYQKISLGVKSLVNIMNFEINCNCNSIAPQNYEIFDNT